MSPDILPLVILSPVLAWMAVSDFSQMRIPNRLVLAMLGVFALSAPVFLSLDEALWRMALAAAVFAVGFAAFIAGIFAGGDVKALAALQLFIPFGREPQSLYMLTFSAAMLTGILLMVLLRRIAGHPDSPFVSLSVARGFPMGISIAMGGLAYPLVFSLH